MTRVYRVLRQAHAKAPLDGEGAYRYGGRWSSRGTRLAYTSEHLSLAMLEYFVHIDAQDPPADLVTVAADVPDRVSRLRLRSSELPAEWRAFPAPAVLAAIGDEFVERRPAAVLIVPSVLAPSESNWLIDPMHPQFGLIRVQPPEPFRYDERLFEARPVTKRLPPRSSPPPPRAGQ